MRKAALQKPGFAGEGTVIALRGRSCRPRSGSGLPIERVIVDGAGTMFANQLLSPATCLPGGPARAPSRHLTTRRSQTASIKCVAIAESVVRKAAGF